MDWIREWVLQIAGVIVLGAICDLIMIEGDMKKYVKPILGFVLIFAIIRPVTALSKDKVRLDILQESMSQSDVILQKMDKTQRGYIEDMYEKKLNKRMAEAVRVKYGLNSEVAVSADRKNKTIGNIEQVNIVIEVREGQIVNTESVKRYILEEFGVDNKRVAVVLKER